MKFKKKKDSLQSKKRIKAAKNMIDIIPLVNYDDMNHCIIRKDNRYIDIIQIIPKDLMNVGKDVINHDDLLFEKLYKLYSEDIKIIFTNTPTDVTTQLKYFENRIKKTLNPVFLQYLKEKRAELIYLSKKRTSREFFIMLFSDTIEDNIKNMNKLKGTLEYLAKEIDLEKKIRILHKIANKNIQVF